MIHLITMLKRLRSNKKISANDLLIEITELGQARNRIQSKPNAIGSRELAEVQQKIVAKVALHKQLTRH